MSKCKCAGAVLAEKLRLDGHRVTLVTPAERVSVWTVNTLEQFAMQNRVLDPGIEVCANRKVVEFDCAPAGEAPFRPELTEIR